MTPTLTSARPASHPPVDVADPAQRALPESIRAAFATAESLAAAQAFTRRLAFGHYENFSVVSLLLPRRLRQDFCNVYAFCRVADDLSDELHDADASLQWLNRLRSETSAAAAGTGASQLQLALADTMHRHTVPLQPFLDLISAFEQDQTRRSYSNRAELLDYCTRSANPVGRIVLHLCGQFDQTNAALSDCTCSGLQLANFWQDVRRDLFELDRIYLPRDAMAEFGVSEAQLRAGRVDGAFKALIESEVAQAEALFARGAALLPMLPPDVRGQVALFGAGGRAILQEIRRAGFDTLSRRPRLTKRRKARLVLNGLLGMAGSRLHRSRAAQ